MANRALQQLAQGMLPNLFWRAGRHGPNELFLTFDDGPHPEYTPELLAILGRYQVKATFFLVGQQAALYPGIARSIREQGHAIGVHGHRHRPRKAFGLAEYLADFDTARRAIEEAIQSRLEQVVLRPPYGHLGLLSTGLLLLKRNRIALWSLDSLDWDSKSPADLIGSIEACATAGGDIVLFHDDCRNTVSAFPDIVRILAGRGHSFGTL